MTVVYARVVMPGISPEINFSKATAILWFFDLLETVTEVCLQVM